MRKSKYILSVILALVMTVSLAFPALAAEDTKTVTILQTSDIHGMINPFDYASNKDRKSVV